MSFSEAASSISARCRPEYSSTMASCTMVSSRCVAGLSIGMRPFSAIATMMSAMRASPSETRRPTSRSHEGGDGGSWVEPATSAKVNTIMIIAGSASEAIIISRLDPMPPKLVPTSRPASARKKRALPRSAMIAMRSADQENTARCGMSARAKPPPRWRRRRDRERREQPDALSASTTSLRISRKRSR